MIPKLSQTHVDGQWLCKDTRPTCICLRVKLFFRSLLSPHENWAWSFPYHKTHVYVCVCVSIYIYIYLFILFCFVFVATVLLGGISRTTTHSIRSAILLYYSQIERLLLWSEIYSVPVILHIVQVILHKPPPVGQGHLIHDVSRSHKTTHHIR